MGLPADDRVKLVEILALRRCRIAGQLGNEGHHPFVNEALRLISRFPHIEDAEDAGLLIKTGGVQNRAFRWIVPYTEPLRDRVVIRCRAVSTLDDELLSPGKFWLQPSRRELGADNLPGADQEVGFEDTTRRPLPWLQARRLHSSVSLSGPCRPIRAIPRTAGGA